MTLVRPFAGLRPAPQHASAVAAPPYDVLNTEEARARATGKPHSFLHISKPEIDLPAGTDPYAAVVYETGAKNLNRLAGEGVLIRDTEPHYYVYRLKMGDHVQTGIVVAASVADYDTNRIRKHEFTRPDKEDDRVRQIEALNAQTGPVLLAYKADDAVDTILESAAAGAPLYDVTADDGIEHTLWQIADAATVDRLTLLFDAMTALYIADGHHRSAAASRVAAARRGKGKSDTAEYFLAVAFPHDQMRIFDYNRVIKDLGGLSAEAFLAKLGRAVRRRAGRCAGEARQTDALWHVSRRPLVPSRHQGGAYSKNRSGGAPRCLAAAG